ncbi:MAG TPA: hypothetical protein VKZ63_01760 [Kofleriaceae bacterium]|nr:hypothetical protein [Kofleriaceae bacterium]
MAADRPWLAGQITAAAGALLVAVGTLMPWAQAGLLSANGIQKAELDAYILIAFGVVATFSIVLDIARGRRTRPLSLAIAGIITGGISTHDYISLKRQLDALNAESPFLVSVGPGIYLCIGASIAILVGAALIAGAPGKR